VLEIATTSAAAVAGDPDRPGLIGAFVLGVIEGLTEFLPVSSTGHLIVANRLLGDADGDSTFEVVVQVGAISAIAWRYKDRLLLATRRLFGGGGGPTAEGGGTANLWFKLLVSALPAIVAGVLLDEWIEDVLFDPRTVVVTMVLGGFALLALERWIAGRDRAPSYDSIDAIPLATALGIGLFQCLALVPGTSRSGAMIAGALVLGCGRGAAAEFSFLVGLPILYGAALYKTLQDHERVFGVLAADLVLGMVASFLTALWIVGPFVRYVREHTFAPFAWYRIAAGLALLGAVLAGLV
jgi:undecaprenyl-diphosphatase